MMDCVLLVIAVHHVRNFYSTQLCLILIELKTVDPHILVLTEEVVGEVIEIYVSVWLRLRTLYLGEIL